MNTQNQNSSAATEKTPSGSDEPVSSVPLNPSLLPETRTIAEKIVEKHAEDFAIAGKAEFVAAIAAAYVESAEIHNRKLALLESENLALKTESLVLQSRLTAAEEVAAKHAEDSVALAESLKAAEADRDTQKALVLDFCADDTKIRDLVRPILTPLEVDGDSYGVPTPVDIVETLVSRLTAAEQSNAEMREKVEGMSVYARHTPDCALGQALESPYRGVFTDCTCGLSTFLQSVKEGK
jgi:hypothetical protein